MGNAKLDGAEDAGVKLMGAVVGAAKPFPKDSGPADCWGAAVIPNASHGEAAAGGLAVDGIGGSAGTSNSAGMEDVCGA